jgi:hypothetical protein
MTQAFNLSQFANKLNTSGQTDNTGLQNSSLTVTAGTGMSGGGSVALGSSVTLTNAGVTSVTASTGISVSASTGGVTITNTSPGTAYSAGNGIGISGSTISIACPSFNSVGSYASADYRAPQNAGSNYAGTTYYNINNCTDAVPGGTLSGTWKSMGYMSAGRALWCRVS